MTAIEATTIIDSLAGKVDVAVAKMGPMAETIVSEFVKRQIASAMFSLFAGAVLVFAAGYAMKKIVPWAKGAEEFDRDVIIQIGGVICGGVGVAGLLVGIFGFADGIINAISPHYSLLQSLLKG